MVYVHSATARELTLSQGPDDGIRVWLHSAEVTTRNGCQGSVVDYFAATESL